MRNFLVVVFKNVVNTFFLIFCLNLLCVFALMRADKVRESRKTPYDDRIELPNYRGVTNAKEIFSEFYTLPTGYVPFTEWRRLPFKGQATTINADGFRVHTSSLTEAEKANAKSVAFFGGSTMWGSGVDDQGTIPAAFESLGTDFNAFNYSESGYNSRQNLENFLNEIHKGTKMEVAVFLDGVNDVITTCRIGASVNTHEQEDNFKNRLTETPPPTRFSELVQPIVSLVKIVFKVRSKLPLGTTPLVYDCDKNPEKAERAARIMLDNWKAAKTLADAFGIRLYTVLQPVSAVGTPNLSHLKLDPHIAAQYASVYPRIKRLMAERKYEWAFDHTNLFDGSEFFYIDFCHVSKNGNLALARAIRNDLLHSQTTRKVR